MNISIGCDEAAYELKENIKAFVEAKGHTVKDFGVHDSATKVLYPDIALAVAQSVAAGQSERGILLCGTGMGMAIAANKVPGIRATVCHDPYSAERARKSNDAQILCLGARVVAAELAKVLVEIWLSSEFEGGGSVSKLERIAYIEKTAKEV